MKRVLVGVLSLVLAGTAAAGPAPQDAAGTTKAKKTKTSSVASQLKTMSDAIDAQQKQIEQLRQELQSRDQVVQQLQQRLDQSSAAAAAAQAQAQQASAAAANASNANDVNALRSDVNDLKQNESSTALSLQETQKNLKEAIESPIAIHYKGVLLTPGGFLAGETVYRTRALGADINTPFNSIPYPGAGAANTSEFFGSGRQSRISLLAEGKLSSAKLSGYYEADFLSAGITSNNNESNSYTLRQRQAWAQAALNSGWTFTGGQMWSLVTETKNGVDNRTEAVPLTIDPQYTVGFSWARQYGFRISKKVGNNFWAAFSVEDPQETLTAHGANNNFFLGSAGSGGGLYNSGITTCTTNSTTLVTTCTNAANYSFNAAPDLIFKLAAQGGPAHFELFGVLSQFRDRVYPCALTTGPCDGKTGPNGLGAYNDTRTGGGFGANARVSLIHKQLDLGFHAMGGDGTGRYSTGTLSDVTVRPDGTLAMIRNYAGLATIELHPKRFDVYVNYGGEYAARTWYTNTLVTPSAPIGYGAPTFNNSGCGTEGVPGPGGFAPAPSGSCTGDTRYLSEATVGFWFKPYNGPKGRIQFGPQYSYIERDAWSGKGGAPKATDNMFLTSFRYYLP
jgi:hypothetical protein